MTDLTEQQEQEMIERAKAGDPEANYQMSLWALEQSMAEPDEERWNRLAAKCLVKAAEAGYEPAKEKMNELLAQTADSPEPESIRPQASPQETYAPQAAPDARTYNAPQTASDAQGQPARDKAAAFKAKAAAAGSAIAAGAGKLFAKIKGLFSKSGTERTADGAAAPADGKKSGFFNFSQWDDAKWKRMQLVCVVICVILALLIIILLVTGKSKKNEEAEEVIPTPVTETVTPVPASTPEPVLYPDAATREEIAAVENLVQPDDGDFVDAAKTVTVSTSGSVLNLRSGPGQSNTQVGSLPNGTTLDVYAYKNGWALVKYNDTWGWCSNDYLK